MNLYDLLLKNNAEDVVIDLVSLYPHEEVNYKGYLWLFNHLLGLEIVFDPKFQVNIELVEDFFNPLETFTSVALRNSEDLECLYAMEYKSWSEVLGYEILPEVLEKYTEQEIIAHMLVEMTWAGWSQEHIQERYKQITDAMEEVIREENAKNTD